MEIIDANRAAVAAAVGLDGAVVVDEVIATLERDDRVVVGITVAGDFVDDPVLLPWASGRVGCSVGSLLGEVGRVGEIVGAVALMQPRGLGETLELLDGVDGAVQLEQVGRESGPATLGVPPIKVGLAVVVDEYGGIDVVPPDFHVGGHVVRHEGRAAGVHEGAGRRVGDGHADGHTLDGGVFDGGEEVELALVLYDLTGPSGALGPFKIGRGERGAVRGPSHHVVGRVAQPPVHSVVAFVVGRLVLAGVEVYAPVVNERGGIGGVDVGDNGVGPAAGR